MTTLSDKIQTGKFIKESKIMPKYNWVSEIDTRKAILELKEELEIEASKEGCCNFFVVYKSLNKVFGSKLCSSQDLKEALVNHKPQSSAERFLQGKETSRLSSAKWRRKNHDKLNTSAKRYIEKNKHKKRAWDKAGRGIGSIEVKGDCQVCKKEKAVDRHHPDYSKPREVVLVCKQCHKDIHKEKNDSQGRGNRK